MMQIKRFKVMAVEPTITVEGEIIPIRYGSVRHFPKRGWKYNGFLIKGNSRKFHDSPEAAVEGVVERPYRLVAAHTTEGESK